MFVQKFVNKIKIHRDLDQFVCYTMTLTLDTIHTDHTKHLPVCVKNFIANQIEFMFNSLHAGYIRMLFCHLWIFFKINFLKKNTFQEYLQSVK